MFATKMRLCYTKICWYFYRRKGRNFVRTETRMGLCFCFCRDFCQWPLGVIKKGKLQNRVFFSHFTIKYNDPLYTIWHITISPICFCHLQYRVCIYVKITISRIITTKSPFAPCFVRSSQRTWYTVAYQVSKMKNGHRLAMTYFSIASLQSLCFPVSVGFQVYYCHTSMVVIISSIVTSPSNVELHVTLHGRPMFVSDASYSTLRSFPYAVP
jgi:hypothetical protein